LPNGQGQVLVIFAVALLALLLFIGLAVDAGAVYVTYGQLKRAVDAAAVAAANDFKRGTTVAGMAESAREVLRLHNVDLSITDVVLHICDEDKDGLRDASLQTTYPQFYARCPNTQANESPRKLVFVEAVQRTPLYFLNLIGFHSLTLTTNAIAEAAPVDLVIVLDLSESMASDTIASICQPFWNAGANCPVVDNYDPDGQNAAVFDSSNPPTYVGSGTIPGCNTNNTCQPLLQAKEAAKALIDRLYDGYDQVSIVTFDSQAVVIPIANKAGNTVDLSDSIANAKNAVDAIKLHDDPPVKKLMPNWYNPGRFNPVNPEDRDGDGSDYDFTSLNCQPTTDDARCCVVDADRWDSKAERQARGLVFNTDPYGWGGVPCDDDQYLDTYDWNMDGIFTIDDHNAAVAWLSAHDPDGSGPLQASLSPLSTCTGCGIRMAANVLKSSGRPGAVWVIVFLSDGVANLSDTPATNSRIPPQYANGFCQGSLGLGFWPRLCLDHDLEPRYCIDADDADGVMDNQALTCPPNTDWNGQIPRPQYSVMDYARDMIDEAALTKSTNLKEPAGNDIAIYAIGLGEAGTDIYYQGVNKGAIGEQLLRYMAAVGDDGDRTTDPCRNQPKRTDCGQYYYAPSGDRLLPIFEDIATRIYTRITE
jgi:hypothetical protein